MKAKLLILSACLCIISATASALLFRGGVGAVGAAGGTLITDMTVYNTSGGSVSNKPVSFVQPFAPAAVGSSNKIEVRKNDGTTVVTATESQCSTWSTDGSRKACAISFIEPDTITAGNSTTYKIYSVSGAPATGCNSSSAQIQANTNFIAKFTGQDLGSDVFDVSLNDILANGSQLPASSSPKQYWEYYASGPTKCGIKATSYLKRESDNAYHKWIKADLYVDFWGSGATPCPCSIGVYPKQANILGPVSGATVGADPQEQHVFQTTLYNGASALINWGGSSDFRVASSGIPAASWSVGTQQINLGSGNVYNGGLTVAPLYRPLQSAVPITLSTSGTLPAGLTAGTLYWMAFVTGANYTTNVALGPTQLDAICNAGYTDGCGGSPHDTVPFTTQGTGTHMITPYVATFPFSGWIGLDSATHRVWVDAAGVLTTAPPVNAGHNFTYLSQSSRALPPYLTNLTFIDVPTPPMTYYPWSFMYPWNLNTTGDGVGDERIGYTNHTCVLALAHPSDTAAWQNCRVMAGSFSRTHTHFEDETVGGQPPVMNNGHAKNGVSYAGLGVVYPMTRSYYNGGGGYAPWAVPAVTWASADGIFEVYQTWMEPSHMPAPWIVPYLRSAEPEWLSFGIDQTEGIIAGNTGFQNWNINGVLYRPLEVNNQQRGTAWAFRALNQAYHYMPDVQSAKPYFADLMSDQCAYFQKTLQFDLTANEKSLGYWPVQAYAGMPLNLYSLWDGDFTFMAVGLAAWQNEFTDCNTYITTNAYKQLVNRGLAAAGGCPWASVARQVAPWIGGNQSSDANLMTTWPNVYENSYVTLQPSFSSWDPWGTAGHACPSSSLYEDLGNGPPYLPVSLGTTYTSALGVANAIGIANADTVYNLVRTQQYAWPSTPLNFNNYNGQTFPEFAIGPLGAAN